MIRTLFLAMLLALGLSACAADSASLPLAEGKPTVLFFYTEN